MSQAHVTGFRPEDCLIAALSTPFLAGGMSRGNHMVDGAGAIDYPALKAQIKYQRGAGMTWVLIAGSTAEPQCLTSEEWKEYVTFAIKVAHEVGLKALVGTGTNCTWQSMDLTKMAADLGADACMLTCPWYNKPSPRMVEVHLGTICKAFPTMPMVLYNIPGRSGINMSAETAASVAMAHPNVIGYKEATENFEQYASLRSLLPPRVSLMCGEDGLLVEAMEQYEFDGLISVTANVAPEMMRGVFLQCLSKDFIAAGAAFEPIKVLIKAMFIEPNPVPVKYAMSRLFGSTPLMRAPLMAATPETCVIVDNAIASLGQVGAAERYNA